MDAVEAAGAVDAVAEARGALAAGRGLDVVLDGLADALPSSLQRIAAFRDVTGLGLRESVVLIEDHKSGVSLSHLGAAQLVIISSAGYPDGSYGHWFRSWFIAALVRREPLLTVAQGSSSAEYGSLRFWRGNVTTLPADNGSGWLSGPGIDFQDFRVAARALADAGSLGRRLAVDDRGDSVLCRFRLD